VLGYIQPIGQDKLIFEAKWLPELDTQEPAQGRLHLGQGGLQVLAGGRCPGRPGLRLRFHPMRLGEAHHDDFGNTHSNHKGDPVKGHIPAATALLVLSVSAATSFAQTTAPAASPAAPARDTCGGGREANINARGARTPEGDGRAPALAQGIHGHRGRTNDLVLDSGQKVETAQTVEMSARMPTCSP